MAEGTRPPEGTSIRCPYDRSVMEVVSREGVLLDRCRECGGMWFDPTELARITGDADLEARVTSPFEFSDKSPFPCPRCGAQVRKDHVANVEVDTCVACRGVWLDAGELSAAQHGVSAERLYERGTPALRDFLRKV